MTELPAETRLGAIRLRVGDVDRARGFYESAIGLRKPEAAAFEFVVGSIGVPAGRVLFFDDALENVEGARSCGLQAVHVTSDTTVADTLAAMGL